jgi:hypothetical protein
MGIGRSLIKFIYKYGFKKFFNRKMPKEKRIRLIAFFEEVICHLPVRPG